MILLYEKILPDIFSIGEDYRWKAFCTKRASLITLSYENIVVDDFCIWKDHCRQLNTSSMMSFLYEKITVEDCSMRKGRGWCLFYTKRLSIKTFLHETSSLMYFLYEKSIIDDFSIRKNHWWWFDKSSTMTFLWNIFRVGDFFMRTDDCWCCFIRKYHCWWLSIRK